LIVRVSVFTPSHRPRYLNECYKSLAAQTISEWEWVVVLNGSAGDWRPPVPDERVRVARERKVKGVGAAKAAACALARGEVLVELDHDDLLAPTCLERVGATFAEHPEVVFVSSDWAQVGEDGSRNDDRFDEGAGWVYDDVEVGGQSYLRCRGLEPSPHNLGYIWYAPNHVRAFRRDAYERVGGYDASLEVLDDQELMIRLYLDGEFCHLPECLYLQRVHRANTQAKPRTNAFIQAQTVALYQANIAELTSAWAARRGLAEVTLRVGGVLQPDREPAGKVVDLDPDRPFLPVPDGGAGAVHALEVLQHVVDRAALFNECHRALAHGGILFTETPSTDGRGAFQDPSHRSFWNENSFWYLTQAALRPALPRLTARFQVSHLGTWYPTAWHEQVQVPYVRANLLAMKDGPRQGGPLLC
jgi:glycosyltransferase involved in cell wall biosynthesis